jgi:type I restriction enzyme S subunit
MAVNVPADYKQTEVGVIPEDWNVKTIDSIAVVTSGGTPSRQIADFWNGDIPWATTTEINWDTIRETAQSITAMGLANSAAKLIAPGALLIALYGQGKTRGKVATLGIQAATNQACAAIVISPAISREFVFHFLVSQYSVIRSLSNSGSQENLSGGIVKSISIPLPSTKAEQEAIAEALSDTDALIESLDQLITKKRQIKQGTMQELLTGKRRLPGFGGEWEVKKLGDLLTIRHGKSQKGVESLDGAYPILATGGQIGRANQFLSDKPSVLIGRKGTIAKPQYMDTPFWTVDTLFYSDIRPPNNAKFLYYRFCLIDWNQYNEASGVPSLNARAIENVEVLCPEPVEQTAIATLLSDMDTELAALESRLAKARQIKQGMMQELLTGRIRLV